MKRFHLRYVSTLSVTLLISHVASLEIQNLVGGYKAMDGQFNYQVSIQVNNSHICGGTLIALNTVLTAAHCICNRRRRFFIDKPYTVVAGINNVNFVEEEPLDSVLVTKAYYHRQFGLLNVIEFDIAILILERDFINSPRIGIASLPLKHDNFEGKDVIVSGFGADDIDLEFDNETKKYKEFNVSQPGILNYGRVKVVKSYKCHDQIHPRILCGQMKENSSGVCAGDSGSPLVDDNNIVIGIVSTSPVGCNESKYPSIYTSVSYFVDIIHDVLMNKNTPNMVVVSLSKYKAYKNPVVLKKNIKSKRKIITDSIILQAVLENLELIHKNLKITQDHMTMFKKSIYDLYDLRDAGLKGELYESTLQLRRGIYNHALYENWEMQELFEKIYKEVLRLIETESVYFSF